MTAAPKDTRAAQEGFKRHMRDYGLLLSLIVILAFFQFATGGTVLRPLNVTNLILQNSYIVIMALGMLLIIVAGHIDLSVGSTVAFVGALAAVLIVRYEFHFIPAILLCLTVGGMIGAVQGYWVAYLKIPSFIVTLAGMLVFRGLTLALLQGQSIGPFPLEFQRLSSGFIPELTEVSEFKITSLLIGMSVALLLLYRDLRKWRHTSSLPADREPGLLFWLKAILLVTALSAFSYLMASYKGLPNVLTILFILVLAYEFVTTRTIIGRRLYALGGNEKAAKLSGIKTDRLVFMTFINMGILAALAGLVFTARLNTATPKAGLSFELDVIAACFIGGASAAGGVGKVMGAVTGAFIMGVMNNGMSILGIGIDYQQVIKGLVLALAVYIDVYNKNKT